MSVQVSRGGALKRTFDDATSSDDADDNIIVELDASEASDATIEVELGDRASIRAPPVAADEQQDDASSSDNAVAFPAPKERRLDDEGSASDSFPGIVQMSREEQEERAAFHAVLRDRLHELQSQAAESSGEVVLAAGSAVQSASADATVVVDDESSSDLEILERAPKLRAQENSLSERDWLHAFLGEELLNARVKVDVHARIDATIAWMAWPLCFDIQLPQSHAELPEFCAKLVKHDLEHGRGHCELQMIVQAIANQVGTLASRLDYVRFFLARFEDQIEKEQEAVVGRAHSTMNKGHDAVYTEIAGWADRAISCGDVLVLPGGGVQYNSLEEAIKRW